MAQESALQADWVLSRLGQWSELHSTLEEGRLHSQDRTIPSRQASSSGPFLLMVTCPHSQMGYVPAPTSPDEVVG